MKPILFLLIFLSISLNGQNNYLHRNQYIDGPANVRETPNGEILFSLNDYTDIRIHQDQPQEEDWRKIGVGCFVNEEDLTDITQIEKWKKQGKIKAGSTIYNRRGEPIGKVLKSLTLSSDITIGEFWRTGFSGYTHQANIRESISNKEMLAHKKVTYFNSCQNYLYKFKRDSKKDSLVQEFCTLDQNIANAASQKTFSKNKIKNTELRKNLELLEEYQSWTVDYEDDYGWPRQLFSLWYFKEKEIVVNGQKIKALIRINQLRIHSLGVGKYGPNSRFTVDVFTNYLQEKELVKKISLYADEIEITDKQIIGETWGFGGVDESDFKYYDLSSGEEVKK